MWLDPVLVLSFCISAWAYHALGRDRLLAHRPATGAVTSENDIYYGNLKLRHHSRFPNLDRVMSKIDGLQAGKVDSGHKIRHQSVHRTTTTDEGLFGDDYGEVEYEDDTNNELNDYDEWGDDSENTSENFDDYEDDTFDDDPFSDDESEWQAEEATEPPVTVSVSPLTKYKWDHYGTRPKVEESRRQQLHLKPAPELRATSAVMNHYMKVKQEAQCRKPLPKVVSVQSVYPDPAKTYTPQCTILHRCAEDTGCCTTFDTKCGPKTQMAVQLYFYTKTLGIPETKVEKLTFYNHTECACLERSKQNSPATLTQDTAKSTHPQNIRHCRCPETFTPKFRYESRCSCDCEEHNLDCLRMKKGKEFFSLTDRKCILEDRCGIPVCEYGVYLRQIGRCQQKREKLESYSKLSIK